MIDFDIRYLTTGTEVVDHIEWLNNNREYVVLDVETNSKNPHIASIIEAQLSGTTVNSAVIFDVRYLQALKMIRSDMILVGQNLKYDFIVLNKHGIDLTDYRWEDTMLLDHLVDENVSHSLENILNRRYGEVNYKADFWDKYNSYDEAPLKERHQYAGSDIIYTDLVYRDLKGELNAV